MQVQLPAFAVRAGADAQPAAAKRRRLGASQQPEAQSITVRAVNTAPGAAWQGARSRARRTSFVRFMLAGALQAVSLPTLFAAAQRQQQPQLQPPSGRVLPTP